MESGTVFHTEPKNYRHEYKHVINYADYLALRTRLKAVAKPDMFAGTDGTYRIRSLYFDNIEDKALREKLDGISVREKFRIRYYNDDASFMRLEKKLKRNNLCGKVSTVLTSEECKRLLSGDTEWMTEKNDGLLFELYVKMKYQGLKPRAVVDYVREPYIFEPGNVRVTIDSRIRSGIYEGRFPDPDMTSVPAGSDIILEVKYDEFLPEVIHDLIQLERVRTSAFSKYAAVRISM